MKNRIAWMMSVPALAVLVFAGRLVAQDKPAAPAARPAAAPQKPGDTLPAPAQQKQTKEQIIATQKPSYPLDTCPISGHKLGGDMGAPIDYVAGDRLVRLCCKDCVAECDKTAGAVFAKIDAAVIAKQKANYPLAKCPISGEALGGMGEPVDFVAGTRLVRFCCNKCVGSFKKDPAATMKQIDAAYIEAQKPGYKLMSCPVSGEKFEGADAAVPVDYLYGTRLVRFCCKDCIKEFNKEPEKYMAKIDAPAVKK